MPSAWRRISSSSAMPAPKRSARAHKPTDRARRDLDHPRLASPSMRSSACTGPSTSPSAAHARPVTSSTRASVARVEARRRDVDRLLEVRADERVGLVEDREHRRASPSRSSPSTATSTPGTYSSTSSGPSAMARTRARGRACARRRRRRGSRPGSRSGRPASPPRVARRSGAVDRRRRSPRTRAAAPRPRPARARIAALSRVAATAAGGLCGKPEALARGGGDEHALVVDRDHRVDRRRARRARRSRRPRPRGRRAAPRPPGRPCRPPAPAAPRSRRPPRRRGGPRRGGSRAPGRCAVGSRRSTRGTALSWSA